MQTRELIKKYFAELAPSSIEKLERLGSLYREWNLRINVISRKDIDHFELRHLLHSLGIMKVISFRPGAMVMDIGTGGGFPGIPLAICFPETEFLLVDSIRKKISVVNEVARSLSLHNVRAIASRAEQISEQADFVVSRAVTALPSLLPLVMPRILSQSRHELPNGLLYLKGGDFTDELRAVNKIKYQIWDLADFFDEDFFQTKKLLHIPNRLSEKHPGQKPG